MWVHRTRKRRPQLLVGLLKHDPHVTTPDLCFPKETLSTCSDALSGTMLCECMIVLLQTSYRCAQVSAGLETLPNLIMTFFAGRRKQAIHALPVGSHLPRNTPAEVDWFEAPSSKRT